MAQIQLKQLITMLLVFVSLQGCKEKDASNYSKYPMNWCRTTEIVARSIKTDCNIQFWDIMYQYTYISLESSFYTIGPPCNESAFEIKYINSKHDHNEPDYTITLKMNYIDKEDFFKPGLIFIHSLSIFEENLSGGYGQYYPNADITLVWDEVSLLGNTYSGKGKIIINKDIPHSSFANYKYPAQEIPFEFHKRERLPH